MSDSRFDYRNLTDEPHEWPRPPLGWMEMRLVVGPCPRWWPWTYWRIYQNSMLPPTAHHIMVVAGRCRPPRGFKGGSRSFAYLQATPPDHWQGVVS